MTVSVTQNAILALLIQRREIPLTGNKESFSYILRQGQLWVMVNGDPMTGEKSDSQITDADVLRAVLWKVRDRLGVYGPDNGEVRWEDVLRYYAEGGY